MLVRIINLQQKDNKAVMNSCADNDGHLTKVEQVACPFIVWSSLGKSSFRDELVGLVVEVVSEIVAQQQVRQCGLTLVIRPQGARTQSTMQKTKHTVRKVGESQVLKCQQQQNGQQ